MEALQQIISPEIIAWIQVVFTAIGAAAVVAANIPHDADNPVWKIINLIAQNYKNAKNK